VSGKIALDIDVAIMFLNGNETIDAFLAKQTEVYLPVIVAGELIFGALNSKNAEQNLSRHKKLIQKSLVLPIAETTANTYAKTRLSLKKKGKPIPENDLWIASLCIEHKIPLLSNDSHFENIEHLTIVNLSAL
jgi:tRNA(fMet)-specific endonuclease VapC